MSERRVIWKLFWAWDWELEENWLNRMAKKGWLLDRVGFCRYEFIKGEPGSYQYRLQALDRWNSNPQSQDYIAFVESTGAELVDTYTFWAYFRQSSNRGPFELFSDTSSRMRHLGRIRMVILPILFLNIFNLTRMLEMMSRFHDAWILWCFLPLCIALTTLLAYGLMRIQTQVRKMHQENNLNE